MADPLTSLVGEQPLSDMAQSAPTNLSSITASTTPKKGGRAGVAAIGSMLGIFAGPYAAANLAKAGYPEPQKALEMAKKMDKDGKSHDEIYKATSDFLKGTPFAGVAKIADGNFRFEIPDNEMKIKKSGPFKRLDEAIDHPLLFKAYPLIAGESGEIGNDIDPAIGETYTDPGTGVTFGGSGVTYVNPDPKDPQRDARHLLAHELNHSAQLFEGNEYFATVSPGMFKNNDDFWKAYVKQLSEGEAEESRHRADLTPEQRRAQAPAYSSPEGSKGMVFSDKYRLPWYKWMGTPPTPRPIKDNIE